MTVASSFSWSAQAKKPSPSSNPEIKRRAVETIGRINLRHDPNLSREAASAYESMPWQSACDEMLRSFSKKNLPTSGVPILDGRCVADQVLHFGSSKTFHPHCDSGFSALRTRRSLIRSRIAGYPDS
jgi:hypothetical protein